MTCRRKRPRHQQPWLTLRAPELTGNMQLHEFVSFPLWKCLLSIVVIFMPPPLGTGGFMFSGCPSVRPSEAWNILFLLIHPTNRDRFAACPSVRLPIHPSVRPERFPGICRRMHGGNGLKFCLLMYLDHLPNWLVYGHSMLIFLLLTLVWLAETGRISGFQAFPGERMEKVAWNFTWWCILATHRND